MANDLGYVATDTDTDTYFPSVSRGLSGQSQERHRTDLRSQCKTATPAPGLQSLLGREGESMRSLDATESLVRFDLEEKEGVTTVRLTHSGLASERSRASHKGWPQILMWLQAYVQH